MKTKIPGRICRTQDCSLPVKTLLGFVLVSISGYLQAATTYQYSGNSFDGFANSPPAGVSNIGISITLPSPLLPNQTDQLVFPTAYSMTDGVTSITQASGYLFPCLPRIRLVKSFDGALKRMTRPPVPSASIRYSLQYFPTRSMPIKHNTAQYLPAWVAMRHLPSSAIIPVHGRLSRSLQPSGYSARV